MGRKCRYLPVLALIMALTGCGAGGSAYMQPANPAKAEEGRAVISFMRPTNYGFAVIGGVYDITDGDTKFVGIVPPNKIVSYAVEPGKKLFMVVCDENADFLNADIKAGMMYYANVIPRPGAFGARMSLIPVRVDEDLTIEKIRQWIAESEPIENTEKSREWAKKREKHTEKMKTKFLKKWNERPESDQQRLRSEDGL